MEARFPRETERLLLLAAFLRFFSSSEELEEDDPARAGVAVSSAAAAVEASPSAGLGATSVLFLGVELAAAAGASVAGLPVGRVSASAVRELANATPFDVVTRCDAS